MDPGLKTTRGKCNAARLPLVTDPRKYQNALLCRARGEGSFHYNEKARDGVRETFQGLDRRWRPQGKALRRLGESSGIADAEYTREGHGLSTPEKVMDWVPQRRSQRSMIHFAENCQLDQKPNRLIVARSSCPPVVKTFKWLCLFFIPVSTGIG